MSIELENSSVQPAPPQSNKYGHFKSEFKSYIGVVVDLTEKKLKEGAKASSQFFNKAGMTVLGLASSINFSVHTILNQIREQRAEHSGTLEDLISGISILGGTLNILSLLNLIEIFNKIKTYPELLRSAKKTDEIGRVILKGVTLTSKVLRIPIRIMAGFAPFFENFHIDLLKIVDFSTWAPALGTASLVLYTASSALKIWNIYDILKFADKMKKECCRELIIHLEDDLKKEFKDNKALLDKMDLALAEAKTKNLKKLHKKGNRFQTELSKKKPDPKVLLGYLNELPPLDEADQTTLDTLYHTIYLYDLDGCLADPYFKTSISETMSNLLNKTSKEMQEMASKERAIAFIDKFTRFFKKDKSIDLKILKKEIKEAAREKAAGDPSSEIADRLNRSAKLAYMSVLSKYNTKKLSIVYKVDGNEVQGAAKKTLELAKTLIGQKEINQADEKLTIAYRELKDRITYQTFSNKMAVVVRAIGMASSTIFLAISFGTLPSPAAPAGIALGVLSAAMAVVLHFMDRYKELKFQENIGITQLKFQENLQSKLEKIEEETFIKKLNKKQIQLFNLVKRQVQDENFQPIYSRFEVPKITRRSTKKERTHQQAIKKMNRIIETMNTRAQQQRATQERALAKYWKKELKKIGPEHLPESHVALQRDMMQIINKKEGERIANLRVIPMQDNWSIQEKIAIKNLNKLIESMQTSAYEHFENRIINLKKGIEILKSKLDEGNNEVTEEKLIKWQKELEISNRIFSQLQLNKQKSSP